MNTNFLNSLTNFLKKRTFELMGLCLIFVSLGLIISFITYSPEDPSFIYLSNKESVANILGLYGSSVSDFLLQSFGIVSFLFAITLICWGYRLLVDKELNKLIYKIFFLNLYIISGCTFIYLTFNTSYWLIDNGNSGFVGKITFNFINIIFHLFRKIILNYFLLYLRLYSF